MKFKVELIVEPDDNMTEDSVEEMIQENCLEYVDAFPGIIYIKNVEVV